MAAARCQCAECVALDARLRASQPLLEGRTVSLEPLTRAKLAATEQARLDDPPCPDPACACPSCTAAYHETLRRFAASLEPLPLIRPRPEDPGAAGQAAPPCCTRVGSSWCVLTQKHDGKHVPGAPERELPVFTFERGRSR